MSDDLKRLFDWRDQNGSVADLDTNQIIESAGLATDEIRTYVTTLGSANLATADFSDAQEQVAKSVGESGKALKTLGTIGKTALSTIGNIAISMAASWAIGEIFSLIGDAIHRSEILIEKGQQAQESADSIQKEFDSKKSTIDQYKDRYGELVSKAGKDNFGNYTQGSMSTDEWQEFLNISNQLATVMPENVSSIDAAGNRMMNLGDTTDDVNSSLETYLKQQEQIANFNIGENLQDITTGILEQNKALDESSEKLQELSNSYTNAKEAAKQGSMEYLAASSDIANGNMLFKGSTDNDSDKVVYDALLKAKKDLKLSDEQMSVVNSSFKYGENGIPYQEFNIALNNLTDQKLAEFNAYMSNLLATDNIGSAYVNTEAELTKNQAIKKANLQSLLPYYQAYAKSIGNYLGLNLGDDVQESLMTNMSSALGNLDLSKLDESEIDSLNKDAQGWIYDHYLAPIADLSDYDKDTQNAVADYINNLFDFDFSKTSIKDYGSKLSNILGDLSNMVGGDTASDLIDAFGLNQLQKDFISGSKSIIDTFGQDVFDGLQNKGEFDIAVKLIDEGFEGSTAQIQNEIKNRVKTAASIANSETFSSVLSGDNNLKESVSNFQNAVSAINEAKQSLETNGQVDNLLDLKTDYPELSNLINQTNDLGEALSNLKTTEATEMLKEFMSDTKNLTGSEKEAANEYLKSVVQGMDWSDVDFSQITNSLFSSLYESMKDENPEAYSVVKDMTSEFMNQLQSDITSGGFSNAITNNQSTLDGYQNRLTAITDAQKELAESGDLSAASIKALSDAGVSSEKILDGANNGFKNLIDSTMDSFDEFAQKIAQGLDAPDASVWLDYCDSIKQANVETADSFTIWQQSLEDANQGARYDAIQGQLKSVEELWDEGWTGTNDWSDFAKMVDQYGVASVENFEGTLEKVKRYMTDDTSGLTNFLTDLKNAGLAYQDDNGWVVTAENYQQMVDALGVGTEVVKDNMGKLEEQGFHVMYADSVDEATKKVADLNEELVNQEAEFERLKASGADQTYLDEWQAKINDTKEDLETANDLIEKVVNENARQVQLYQEAIDNVRNDDSRTEEEKEAVIAALEKKQKDFAEAGGLSVEQALKLDVPDVEVSNLQDKIKESLENSDTKDEIQGYLDTLGKYTADELKQINYDDGVYDQINGVDYTEAESAIDALCEHYGVAKDEVLSLIDAITTLNKTEPKEPTTPTSGSNSGVPLSNTAYQEKVQEVQVVKQDYSDNSGIGNTTLPTLTQGVDRILEKDESKEPAETIEQDVNRTVKTDNSTSDSASSSSNNEEHVTRIIDEKLGETVESVPDAEGKANFSLGNSPMTVPSASGVANYQLGSYPTSLPTLTQNVVINRINSGILSGGGTVNGNAHANGTPRISSSHFNNGIVGTIGKARANGTSGHWGEPKDTVSLIGETDPELIVRDNHFFVAGSNGAEMVKLKKDDIVFNGKQTKEILENGYTLGRGKVVGGARVNGTARGFGNTGGAHGSNVGGKGSGNNSSSSSNNSSSSNSSGNNNSKKKSSSSTSDKVSKAIEKISKWVSQHFDWIEVKIDHLQKKADSYYTKAQNAIDLGLNRSGNYKTAESNIKHSISTNEQLITANQQGSARYLKQANIVKKKYDSKLSKKNKATFDKAVKTLNNGGTIDISVYNADVKTALEDYQKWHNKVLETKYAVDDLNSTLIEQKQALFNLPIDEATAKVNKLEVALSKLQLTFTKRSTGKNTSIETQNAELDTELKNQADQLKAQQDALNKAKSNLDAAKKAQQSAQKSLTTNKQSLAKDQEAKKTADSKVKSSSSALLKDAKISKTLTKKQKTAMKNGESITLTKAQKRKLSKSQQGKISEYNKNVKSSNKIASQISTDKQNVSSAQKSADSKNQSFQLAQDAYDTQLKTTNEAEKDYLEQIVANEKQKFDNVVSYFEKRTNLIEKQNSRKTAMGAYESAKDYNALISQTTQEIARMNAQLNSSVKSGKIQVGSDEWYEMKSQIVEIETELANLNESARKIRLQEMFERAAESVQKFIDKLQTVNSLITDDMKFDSDGKLTQNGALSMMLDSKSLDKSKENLKSYTKERDRILTTEWKSKGYLGNYVRGVDSELDGLLDDVDSNIKSEIGNIQNYMQSLLSTVITANEKERDAILEVVDAHKEALSKKKDYYDYDKKMKSQNKTISELERQAASLRGSTDKADKAQLQKIEAQLKDAKDERDGMVKDHLYEMQTDALDQISDDINKYYEKMIDALKTSPTEAANAITKFMSDNGITSAKLADQIASVLGQYLDPNNKDSKGIAEEIKNSGLTGTSPSQLSGNSKTLTDAFKNLISKINANSYGTAATTKQINDAQAAYNKLSSTEKSYVSADYKKFTDAKTANQQELDRIAKEAADKKKRQEAESAKLKAFQNAIKALGTDYGSSAMTKKLTAADTAYKALTDAQKKTVASQYSTLTNAKNKHQQEQTRLKNQGNGKIEIGDRVTSFARDKVFQYSNKPLNKNKQLGNLQISQPYYVGEYKKNDIFPVHLYSDKERKKSVGWVQSSFLKGYEKGTPSVKGDQLAWVNENWQTNGGEIIYRKSDGAMLMPLGNGDTVFSADKVQALYKMLETNPLPTNMGNVFTPRDLTTQIQTVNNTPVNYSDSHDIIVQGDLTRDTLPNLQEILKKSSEYTKKEIRKDLSKNGMKKSF